MPKLSAATAAQVDETEYREGGGSRAPIPAGEYRARLLEVVAKQSSTNKPMWTPKFEVIEGEHTGKFLWTNIVVQENTMWKLKEFFLAFDAPTTTPTDELVGHTVLLFVSLKPRNDQPGVMSNNIDTVAPDPESTSTGKTGGGASKPAAAAAAMDPDEF